VLDTSHPPVVAAPAVTVAANASAPTADISANARVREAYAEFQPPDLKQGQPPAAKTPPVAKMAQLKPQPKRKVARNHGGAPMVLAAQQPQVLAQQPQPRFGFFFNNTW
jgi:hypothetical protein